MNIMKHVANVANTGQRCVVAFLQIPNREDHALVIPTDNLPPRFEQAVMDVLKTAEGQQERNFGEALGRHLMPDTRETILEALHRNGKLVPVPVTNVVMLPQPNHPVRLSDILQQLGTLPQQVPEDYAMHKFNPHSHNQQSETSENARSVARGLLIEAEMLEGEAKRKRDQAYLKDPSLKANGSAPSFPQATQKSIYPQATPMTESMFATLDKLPEPVMTNYQMPLPLVPPVESTPTPNALQEFDDRLRTLENVIGKLADHLMPNELIRSAGSNDESSDSDA